VEENKITRLVEKFYSFNGTKYFSCFVDRASRYISVMKTNLMHCFSSVYVVNQSIHFDVLLTSQLSVFISAINQLDAHNFCFTISLFHASTCFEDICSSSGDHNCITQPLVSSHL